MAIFIPVKTAEKLNRLTQLIDNFGIRTVKLTQIEVEDLGKTYNYCGVEDTTERNEDTYVLIGEFLVCRADKEIETEKHGKYTILGSLYYELFLGLSVLNKGEVSNMLRHITNILEWCGVSVGDVNENFRVCLSVAPNSEFGGTALGVFSIVKEWLGTVNVDNRLLPLHLDDAENIGWWLEHSLNYKGFEETEIRVPVVEKRCSVSLSIFNF